MSYPTALSRPCPTVCYVHVLPNCTVPCPTVCCVVHVLPNSTVPAMSYCVLCTCPAQLHCPVSYCVLCTCPAQPHITVAHYTHGPMCPAICTPMYFMSAVLTSCCYSFILLRALYAFLYKCPSLRCLSGVTSLCGQDLKWNLLMEY